MSLLDRLDKARRLGRRCQVKLTHSQAEDLMALVAFGHIETTPHVPFLIMGKAVGWVEAGSLGALVEPVVQGFSVGYTAPGGVCKGAFCLGTARRSCAYCRQQMADYREAGYGVRGLDSHAFVVEIDSERIPEGPGSQPFDSAAAAWAFVDSLYAEIRP